MGHKNNTALVVVLFLLSWGIELGKGENDSFIYWRRGIGEPEGSPKRSLRRVSFPYGSQK